jgi:DNA-binding LacI/PurR family transcriptional regulator
MTAIDCKGKSVLGKAESLALQLEAELATGSLRVGAMYPSVQDLVTRYGISAGTVRKSLLGLVEADILRHERGAGYQVNSIPSPKVPAGGLTPMQRTEVKSKLLVLLDDVALDSKHQSLLGKYVQGLMSACDTAELELELMRNDDQTLRQRLSRGDVRAILCYYLTESLLDDVSDDIAVIAFGHFPVHPNQITLVADVEAGVHEAYRHLFGLGHDNVIMLISDINQFFEHGGSEYLLGMRRAFADYGVTWSRDRVVVVPQGDLRADGDFLRKQMEAGVTGLFAPDWPEVFGVYRQAHRAGLQISQDMSVVAFGNHPWAELLDPEITRIVWDPIRHGEKAVALIRDMADQSHSRGNVIRMPVRLVCGKSSGSILHDAADESGRIVLFEEDKSS